MTEQPLTGDRCDKAIIGYWENKICKRLAVHDGDCDPKDDRNWFGLRLPDAGSYDDEDIYNFDTDGYDPRKLVVRCPLCEEDHRALCSRYTEPLAYGMRWVGCDHREPYTDYVARCPKKKLLYRFTTYTPQ